MSKYTKGPWKLEQSNKLPFDYAIVDADGNEVSSQRSVAHSTDQKSLDDFENAVGFRHFEREEIQKKLAEQRANLKLQAAAPELLGLIEAMRSYFHSFAEDGVRPDEWIMREWVGKCDKAMAKAEGRDA
jgi:hypothetical protein